MSKFKSFRTVLLSIFCLSIGIVFAAQLQIVRSASGNTNPKLIRTEKNPTSKQPNILNLPNIFPTSAPETESHILSATYYQVSTNFESVLMVSNQGPNPMPVQVSLFNLSGERFDLPLVVLNGKEVRAFNLRNYIQSPNFYEGSLQVNYQGKRLELGGVVQNVDANRSLMFDEELSETKYFASTKLEGVWWTKWNDVKMDLAISNTTSNPVAATINVEGTRPKQKDSQTIYLSPHQTRVLNIEEIVGKNVNQIQTVGGISISHNGAKGGILARGLIYKANLGYSNVIEFSDPEKPKSTKIDGVGLRIGTINGQSLTQGIVARNVGETRVKLGGYLSYKKQNSSGEITIPDVWLNAGEVREINIGALLSSNNITSVLASGLHFEHNGLPGKVVIAAQSVSQDGNNIFRVPFKDSSLSSSVGIYPYSLDGDSKAIVYLQNVVDEPRNYKIEFAYEGGSYVLGVKNLQAKQVIAYDIRKIRDEQTPDIYGNTIPLSVTGGKALWSVKGKGNRDIIGRIEQADLTNGLSNTSACGACCPDSTVSAYLTPYSVVGFPGDINPFTVIEQDMNCYGGYPSPYPTSYPVNFSSSDTSVATINSSGVATGVGVGSTIISAYFEGVAYESCGGEIGNDEYCCDEVVVPMYCDASCDIRPSVTSILGSIPSTKNPTATPTPVPGNYTTTNISTAFATESTTDIMAVFQSSSETITITAQGINPTNAGSQLKWKIDRDSNDTVATGIPALSSQIGSQVTFSPTSAGNFRLTCYYDMNNNNSYDNGEELRVLLFVVIRVSIVSNNCTIDSPLANFQGDFSMPNEFGVLSGSLPMSMSCVLVVEGGGANKRIGANKIFFGNVGNLTSDTAKVNYSSSGIATENPGASLPMVDTVLVTKGNSPTGGDTAFRGDSSQNRTNGPNGGQTLTITSSDAPNFGPYKIMFPNTSNIWANTQGGYDFTEFIAGYSNTFPRSYVVAAKASWTIRFIGSRSTTGMWMNGSSGITLQGTNQTQASFTNSVTNGSPQTGNSAGIQVLGLSYVNEHKPVYTP